MLDGYAPTRKDATDPTSEQIWLKERVAILLQRHEEAADKLIETVLSRGAPDNIAMIIASVV